MTALDESSPAVTNTHTDLKLRGTAIHLESQ